MGLHDNWAEPSARHAHSPFLSLCVSFKWLNREFRFFYVRTDFSQLSSVSSRTARQVQPPSEGERMVASGFRFPPPALFRKFLSKCWSAAWKWPGLRELELVLGPEPRGRAPGCRWCSGPPDAQRSEPPPPGKAGESGGPLRTGRARRRAAPRGSRTGNDRAKLRQAWSQSPLLNWSPWIKFHKWWNYRNPHQAWSLSPLLNWSPWTKFYEWWNYTNPQFWKFLSGRAVRLPYSLRSMVYEKAISFPPPRRFCPRSQRWVLSNNFKFGLELVFSDHDLLLQVFKLLFANYTLSCWYPRDTTLSQAHKSEEAKFPSAREC